MIKQWPAEEANYWKSSKSAEAAITAAKKEIAAVGGTVLGYAYAEDTGRAAHVLTFTIEGQRFRTVYPVLLTKAGEVTPAGKVQAAAALKHDVKAKCVAIKWRGLLGAFGADLVLDNGRTVAEAQAPELISSYPLMITGRAQE